MRLAKGLSQEKLAFEAGMHRTYLGGIERGERNPTLKNIVRLARALGVNLPELFDFQARTMVALGAKRKRVSGGSTPPFPACTNDRPAQKTCYH